MIPERYRLTEEEIKSAILERTDLLDSSMKKHHSVADAAAEKAMREALKDVYRWLDQSAYAHSPSVIRLHIARLELDAFGRGEMPPDRPRIAFKSGQLPASPRSGKGKEG